MDSARIEGGWKDRMPSVGGVATLAILCTLAFCVVWAFDQDGSILKGATSRKPKAFSKTIAEGVRVSRHGVYGVDFIKCGSCRIVKRKKGVLTFGGLNVLEMDDLSIVLPPQEARADMPPATKGDSPRDLVRRLGVSDGFLSSRGMPAKFSGLRISGLIVSRLGTGGKPEMMFSASSAEAVRGGLALKGCRVVQPTGVTEMVGKAMLTQTQKSLRLSWRGGEMDLASS